MCKNFEQHGHCKYGDECSFAHGKQQIMNKSDVPVLYKTKLCKKYMQNGYCPYGQRCQFIHGRDARMLSSIENSPQGKNAVLPANIFD